MLTTTGFAVPACRAALVAACLLGLAGCRGGHSPGQAEDGHEDHVGHVIPAHKPKAFPQAVHRLRELNDQFIHDVGAGQAGSSLDEKTLHIALDIANWLPEIAADSDMPEPQWDEVNARSAPIVADYQAIVSGDAGNVPSELKHAGAEIGKLEELLLASDPK
ncbi:MAG: hypothetical protein ACLQGP_24835 [Isosphaeraceae bacterium]